MMPATWRTNRSRLFLAAGLSVLVGILALAPLLAHALTPRASLRLLEINQGNGVLRVQEPAAAVYAEGRILVADAREGRVVMCDSRGVMWKGRGIAGGWHWGLY